MLKYFLLAAFIQILWSLTPSASQIILEHFSVNLCNTLRWTIAGSIFAVLVWIRYGKFSFKLRDLPKLFLLGWIGFAFATLGTLHGLKLGGVVNFALVGSVSPLVTAAIAILVLRFPVTRTFVLAATVSTLGLIILVVGKYSISTPKIALLSTGIVFVAYVFEAIPFVYWKKYNWNIPLLEYMAVLQLSSAGFLWVVQLSNPDDLIQISTAPSHVWAALLFSAFVACVLCYCILYWLLNFIEAHKLALFDGLHTVFAAYFGYLFFGEQVNSLMFLGGGLMLLGLYIANVQRPQPISEVDELTESSTPLLDVQRESAQL